eukprot:Gregarina_sp_Poly_1__4714@NODE_2518_length_2037_cov_27_308629_g1600_i0_p1_GENE_NODE_2518_length_2037_cov_27_308629_g1600_i0NODE_2518_length_2037_cov_27_308629_g1600_i0_p1_ORF_typecomplete_len181_score24_56Ribosomal_L34/PF00468_17/9_8e03Ribosomal_L34/PF00468_17/2_3e03Ribosomal_L34/PF00468_17/1_1_NODE_2518_length_2037_cov_27_308629_g1600_i0204746
MKSSGLAAALVMPPSTYNPNEGQYQRLSQPPLFHFTLRKQGDGDSNENGFLLPPSLQLFRLYGEALDTTDRNIEQIQRWRNQLHTKFMEVASLGSRHLSKLLPENDRGGPTGFGRQVLANVLQEKALSRLPPLMITQVCKRDTSHTHGFLARALGTQCQRKLIWRKICDSLCLKCQAQNV